MSHWEARWPAKDTLSMEADSVCCSVGKAGWKSTALWSYTCTTVHQVKAGAGQSHQTLSLPAPTGWHSLFPILHHKGKQAEDRQGRWGLCMRRPSTQQSLQLSSSELAIPANNGTLHVPPTLWHSVPFIGTWKILQVLDGETAPSALEDLSSTQANAPVLDCDDEHNRKACCRLDLVLNKRQIIYFFLQMKHNTKV